MKRLATTLLLATLSALTLLASKRLPAQTVYEDLGSRPDGVIRFRSVTPINRYELAHRSYAPTPVVVWGTLSLPRHGD